MPSDIILTEFPTHFAPSEASVTFCEYPLFEIFILLKFTSLSAIVALKTFAELPPLPTVIFISPKLSPPVIVEFTAASAVPSIARLALSRELPSGLQAEVSDHSNSVGNIPLLVFKVKSSAIAQIANAIVKFFWVNYKKMNLFATLRFCGTPKIYEYRFGTRRGRHEGRIYGRRHGLLSG